MARASSPILVNRTRSSTAAQTSVTGTASTILTANESRRGFVIQNTGTTKIYITLGTDTPTTSVYHFALAACTGANDGLGGVYIDDVWTGAVQAISSGAGGTCVITAIL